MLKVQQNLEPGFQVSAVMAGLVVETATAPKEKTAMTKVEDRAIVKRAKEALLADREGLKELFRSVLQEVLEAEMTADAGAEKGERTEGRLLLLLGLFDGALRKELFQSDEPSLFVGKHEGRHFFAGLRSKRPRRDLLQPCDESVRRLCEGGAQAPDFASDMFQLPAQGNVLAADAAKGLLERGSELFDIHCPNRRRRKCSPRPGRQARGLPAAPLPPGQACAGCKAASPASDASCKMRPSLGSPGSRHGARLKIAFASRPPAAAAVRAVVDKSGSASPVMSAVGWMAKSDIARSIKSRLLQLDTSKNLAESGVM